MVRAENARAITQVAALHTWAERILRWQETLKAVYVYFDNDQAGYAAKNAAELRKMIEPGQ